MDNPFFREILEKKIDQAIDQKIPDLRATLKSATRQDLTTSNDWSDISTASNFSTSKTEFDIMALCRKATLALGDRNSTISEATNLSTISGITNMSTFSLSPSPSPIPNAPRVQRLASISELIPRTIRSSKSFSICDQTDDPRLDPNLVAAAKQVRSVTIPDARSKRLEFSMFDDMLELTSTSNFLTTSKNFFYCLPT